MLFFILSVPVLAGLPPEMKRESDELLGKANPAKIQKILDAANRFLDEYRKPENERKRQIFFKKLDDLRKQVEKDGNKLTQATERQQKEILNFFQKNEILTYSLGTEPARFSLPPFHFSRDDIAWCRYATGKNIEIMLKRKFPPLLAHEKYRLYYLWVEEKKTGKLIVKYFRFADHDSD